jgi:hypothetical protein
MPLICVTPKVEPTPELAVAIATELGLPDPELQIAKAIINGYGTNSPSGEKTKET